MTIPPSNSNNPSVSLTTRERLLLISTLNNMPLTQFLELEYALNIPGSVLPSVDAPQGLRSKALLDWVEGVMGPGINVLLGILEDFFGLPIAQAGKSKSIAEAKHKKTANQITDDQEPKNTSSLLELSINIHIDEVSGITLKNFVDLFRQLSGDDSVEVVNIRKGSVKFRLSGTPEGLERLRTFIASGQSSTLIGASVEYAEFIDIPAKPYRLNLRYADLRDARLNNASLGFADLGNADLRGADLSGTDLAQANLTRANLRGADLHQANLIGANLSNAFLNEANLSGANLSDANLSWANLSRANLSRTDFRGTTLVGIDFDRAQVKQARFASRNGLSKSQEEDLKRRGAVFGSRNQFLPFIGQTADFIRRNRGIALIISGISAILLVASLVVAIFFDPIFILASVALLVAALFPLNHLDGGE